MKKIFLSLILVLGTATAIAMDDGTKPPVISRKEATVRTNLFRKGIESGLGVSAALYTSAMTPEDQLPTSGTELYDDERSDSDDDTANTGWSDRQLDDLSASISQAQRAWGMLGAATDLASAIASDGIDATASTPLPSTHTQRQHQPPFDDFFRNRMELPVEMDPVCTQPVTTRVQKGNVVVELVDDNSSSITTTQSSKGKTKQTVRQNNQQNTPAPRRASTRTASTRLSAHTKGHDQTQTTNTRVTGQGQQTLTSTGHTITNNRQTLKASDNKQTQSSSQSSPTNSDKKSSTSSAPSVVSSTDTNNNSSATESARWWSKPTIIIPLAIGGFITLYKVLPLAWKKLVTSRKSKAPNNVQNGEKEINSDKIYTL